MQTIAETTTPNPFPGLPLDQHWTIAYRKRTGPVFHRVTNWSGTWQQAYDKAAEFGTANPDLQVWYTTTCAYEQAQAADLPSRVASGEYSQALADSYLEDHGNLLVDSGKRVRVVDNGELPAEFGGRVAPSAKVQAWLDQATKLGLLVAETTNHVNEAKYELLKTRTWAIKAPDDPNNIYGQVWIHELRWTDYPNRRPRVAGSYYGVAREVHELKVSEITYWIRGMAK